MPPVTPSTWRNTRLADRFSPVCPQSPPFPGDEALFEIPRGRLAQLKRLLPLLANQSEDCLYLNLYVPRSGNNIYKYNFVSPFMIISFFTIVQTLLSHYVLYNYGVCKKILFYFFYLNARV